MTSKSAVPHHRVNAELHATAKTHAAKVGVSLSNVAAAGLEAYTSFSAAESKKVAKQRVASGKLDRQTASLPEDTATVLAQFGREKSDKLAPFLYSLHMAGWSYNALAEPLGLSRQAIHLRLSKYRPTGTIDDLPLVPSGPGRYVSDDNVKRFDWAIWVDRELYALATQEAADRGQAMQDVMETILTNFISGKLSVTSTKKAG